MTVLSHTFGQTTIAKLSDPHELKQLLVDPWLQSETVIIKPNFVATDPGYATDSEALRALLEALDSRIVVTESHMVPRSTNLMEGGMGFIVGDEEVNWMWLMGGDGWRWQMENPDWGWFREGGHWDQIKKEDKAFLDERGFTDLFNEFDVEYVNVTDEIWSGRIADPTEVKRSVESRFKPAFTEKLYGMVPKKLHDLRGSTFISFAKLQNYASFTLKNLFGMIPDPVRAWWHGPKHSRIAPSIVDINKVYRSLFNVYGICETLHTNPVSHSEGEFLNTLGTRYNIAENLGVVAFGRDPVSLDAIFCNLAGFDINQFGGYIGKAEEEFGIYDRTALEESKMKIGSWLSH
ncbi:MAG: DUF362 domain-containing protein [Candidatus Bathyarchaeota archaeon]|nr:DUF362 domain-containing protein [Candidatus Bathyarchaeota archaeon]